MQTLPNGISLPSSIELFDCHESVIVSANIQELTREVAKNGIDLSWWVSPVVNAAIRRAEVDFNWKWVALFGEMRQAFGKNSFGWSVCTDDGDCQGAILYQVGGVSSIDNKSPTVFCHRLATATRNRERFTPTPRYRGVGVGLIRLAALHSLRAGLQGRVTVETYPDPETRQWYRKLGFQETTKDLDGILDLELVPEAANRLLTDLLV